MTNQCECVWGGSPSPDGCQGPGLEDFLRVLVHPHDTLSCDAEETGDKLVATSHLLLQVCGWVYVDKSACHLIKDTFLSSV